MIRIVTIERKYGSGGSDIGRKLAERGSFEGTLNIPHFNLVDADHILAVPRKLVTSVTREGQAIIVGRGSA